MRKNYDDLKHSIWRKVKPPQQNNIIIFHRKPIVIVLIPFVKKWLVRSHQSNKDRQYMDKRKRGKYNIPQNTTYENKNCAARTPLNLSELKITCTFFQIIHICTFRPFSIFNRLGLSDINIYLIQCARSVSGITFFF